MRVFDGRCGGLVEFLKGLGAPGGGGGRAPEEGVSLSDVSGSPFAIESYHLRPSLGRDEDLKALKERANQAGLRLILDFVPNHFGLSERLLRGFPHFFVQGSEEDVRRSPQNWFKVEGLGIFAHGRDPYFDGWTDTVQLNYANEGLRQYMLDNLMHIASLCDGVRCDMAMLLLPSIIQKTWGSHIPPSHLPSHSFWSEAIPKVLRSFPRFQFIAEVYWDMEWELQVEGFHYTYDKRLYDRLLAVPSSGRAWEFQKVGLIAGHLRADAQFSRKCVRFLENHDEPRIASLLKDQEHAAAAVLCFSSPGMRFFHEGQFEGYKEKGSLHVGKRVREPRNVFLKGFYDSLLKVLCHPVLQNGFNFVHRTVGAWEGNPTFYNFVVFSMCYPPQIPVLVVVNYGGTQGQCYVHLKECPYYESLWQSSKGQVTFTDMMATNRVSFEREVSDLTGRGLFLDMPQWGYHIFLLQKTD
eukprot:TRINITY_DN15436_c0_g1_i1.p1 TRINITY_DN15436_c0_g1~~TRINITY_DN15436_c0_g1_i1.p1  ORF type:complete len:475 (-),score=93.95 TRINITY_DN15436_c0_g1_i1:3-1403(-)